MSVSNGEPINVSDDEGENANNDGGMNVRDGEPLHVSNNTSVNMNLSLKGDIHEDCWYYAHYIMLH